jgi:hypothetical protein
MNRQEYWLKQGYTKDNIENHLRFERRKAKESRERKKKNNEPNKELLKQIRSDLVGKTFKTKYRTFKIISVRESVDGVGFYFTVLITFEDNSKGKFRYFYFFKDYSFDSFIENLKYV